MIITRRALGRMNLTRKFEYVVNDNEHKQSLSLFSANNEKEDCLEYPPHCDKFLSSDDKVMTKPENWGGSFNSCHWENLTQNSAFICKNVFFVKNSYDIFDSNGNAVNASYPNNEVRVKQKKSWGAAHNYIEGKNIYLKKNLNVRNDQTIENQIIYLIKYHEDSDNYFHWIFENLTNLILLTNIVDQAKLEKIKFVSLGSPLKSFQREAIYKIFDSINQPHPKIEECQNDIYFAKKAIVTHARFPGWRCRSSIENLNHALGSANISSKKKHRYIFIERGKTKNQREITNLGQYRKFFESKGFEFITMDGKTIDEQARIIKESKCVIGLHGAAFANLIFANNDINVLELSSKEYIDAPTAFISQAIGFHWSRLMLGQHYSSNDKFFLTHENIRQITSWLKFCKS